MDTFDSLHDKKPVFTIRNMAIMGGVLALLALFGYGGYKLHMGSKATPSKDLSDTAMEAEVTLVLKEEKPPVSEVTIVPDKDVHLVKDAPRNVEVADEDDDDGYSLWDSFLDFFA
jgi:hypothetical protein